MTGFVFIKGKQVAWVSSILKSKSLNQRANIKKKIFADKEHNQLYEGNYAQWKQICKRLNGGLMIKW